MPAAPADPNEPPAEFRREDDPDPNVRAGGAFGSEDPDEWEAWAEAFDTAENTVTGATDATSTD